MAQRDAATWRPEGILAAAVTPFHDDESLDEERLASHLDYLIEAGIHGIVPIGGSGEYVSLSQSERRRIIEVAIDAVNGRVPVVVGALSSSTREVIEIGTHAAHAGADALLVLPPYYIRPSLAGVLDHFERVHAETGLPIIAYNNPPRTGWAITRDALVELAQLPGIIALKECERDVVSIAAKIAAIGDSIAILSGDDDLAFATFLSGARGAIQATPNLTPHLCLDLYRACMDGDLVRATELQGHMLRLFDARRIPNHPGPLKEMMGMAGRPVGPARRPLLPMTPTERERAAAVVSASAGVLRASRRVASR